VDVSDAETQSTIARWLAAGTALVGAWLGIAKWQAKKAERLDARFAAKADHKQVEEIRGELDTQRGHIAKIFDQMRENEHRAQDRHERVMERLR
jgi:hypothetical protein